MHRLALNRASALKCLVTAGLTVLLAACSTASSPVPTVRTDTVRHLAASAHMMESHIQAGEFTIMAFEKMHDHGQAATVYIEDDGNLTTWEDFTVWDDPTPTSPYALTMAADDASPNVVWLARPCQYTGTMDVRPCTKALYTTHRYSPQTIDAMGAALDQIKKRYNVPSFTLVGIGGGAAVAVELAAVRNDVKFLRTVGGVLDTRIMAQGAKGGNPFSGSLNPIDAAPKVANIPQQHSVGAWDKNKSLAMIQSFLTAEGHPPADMMSPSAVPAAIPPSTAPEPPMVQPDRPVSDTPPHFGQ